MARASSTDDGDDAATIDRMDTWEAETRVATPGIRQVHLPGAPARAMTPEQRYVEEEILGEGGMGIVRLSHDIQIGRRVAMKVMQADRAQHPRSRQRFVREARIQGQLEHPAMVPVYDLGVDAKGGIFFTMKRVRGLTLEELINGLVRGDEEITHYWTQRRLLNAFSRVCLAADYCHRQGVLHRDIKPANLMFGEFGEVYLLDWGIAKIWAQSQAAKAEIDAGADPSKKGAILGTPGYMSPEQVRGDEQLGPESDVYSLGAVLFEMLTFRMLHEQADMDELLEATLRPVEARPSRRAPERNIAPELEEICVRAVRLHPFKRFQTARALSDAIEAYLEGQRDVELRHEMAQGHADAGRAALERSDKEPKRLTEHRQAAMREVGQALALDPTNQTARETLMNVLMGAHHRVPAAVEKELASTESKRLSASAGLAALAYLTLLMYVPLFSWAGIENTLVLAFFYMGIAISSIVSAWAWLTRGPTEHIAFIAMLVSTVTFGLSSCFFGPLLLAPSVITNNTAVFAFFFTDWRRWASVAAGALAFLIPLGLELGGVIEPSYSFSADGLVVTSKAISLAEPAPTMVFLTLSSLAVLLTLSILFSGIRTQVRNAERNLLVYTWHLRQLLPTGETK